MKNQASPLRRRAGGSDPVLAAMQAAVARMAVEDDTVIVRRRGEIVEIPAREIAPQVHRVRHHSVDTGSLEVQIAFLTDRIAALAAHLQRRRQDYHSLRGVIRLVSRRRRLLRQLKAQDVERYRRLVASLGLRRARLSRT